MNKSESIANLAQALCLFQGEVSNPKNSATNPFYKCKYAPLSEVINTTKLILSKHGLSVLQSPSGDGEHIIVTTLLMHSSGEWIEGEPLILKAEKITAQGAGSAITYGRRYAMSAILGISSEDDDDGNHATGNKEQDKNVDKPKQTSPPSANKPNNDKAQPIKWPAFWAEMSKLGYDEKQVHEFAKVESLKEWNKVMLDELYFDIKKLVDNAQKGEEK